MVFLVLLIISAIIFGSSFLEHSNEKNLDFVRMAIFFLFYIVVTIEVIGQVWKAKFIGKNVTLGPISGYISLGLIGFFICLSIEIAHPGSFSGLLEATSSDAYTERILYYSYITLLTIGYGDILPVTQLAQKAAVLIGLIGQLYLVIFTAVIVRKYINQDKE